MFYVYVYCDPLTVGQWGTFHQFSQEPFYVGEGTGYRKTAHFSCSRNPEKSQRIQRIRDNGLMPEIIVVADGLTKEESRKLEASLIADIGTLKEIKGIRRGPLTNKNPGGGGVAYHSEETKQRMRLARLGRKHSPETIEKIRSTKAAGCTEEKLTKLSQNRKGGKWMTLGDKTHFVRPDSISHFLSRGYHFGMKPRK
jgi:hypothetical protein